MEQNTKNFFYTVNIVESSWVAEKNSRLYGIWFSRQLRFDRHFLV